MINKFKVLFLLGLLLFGCAKHERIEPKSRIVKISNGGSMCSGEQVEAPSGQSYILTASHCKHIADKDGFTVITEDKKTLKRKLVAEDPKSDLILIEGLPGVQGIPIAKDSYFGQRIRTLTHGNNLDTYETRGELVERQFLQVPIDEITSPESEKACSSMPKYSVINLGIFGKLCVMSIYETISTAMVVPGSSGGAVLNSKDELVGVVSTGNPPFSGFVALGDIKAFLSNY